eukprot:g929.t1
MTGFSFGSTPAPSAGGGGGFSFGSNNASTSNSGSGGAFSFGAGGGGFGAATSTATKAGGTSSGFSFGSTPAPAAAPKTGGFSFDSNKNTGGGFNVGIGGAASMGRVSVAGGSSMAVTTQFKGITRFDQLDPPVQNWFKEIAVIVRRDVERAAEQARKHLPHKISELKRETERLAAALEELDNSTERSKQAIRSISMATELDRKAMLSARDHFRRVYHENRGNKDRTTRVELPPEYFKVQLKRSRERMAQYNDQINGLETLLMPAAESEGAVAGLSRAYGRRLRVAPQDVKYIMEVQAGAFMRISGEVAAIHEKVEKLCEWSVRAGKAEGDETNYFKQADEKEQEDLRQWQFKDKFLRAEQMSLKYSRGTHGLMSSGNQLGAPGAMGGMGIGSTTMGGGVGGFSLGGSAGVAGGAKTTTTSFGFGTGTAAAAAPTAGGFSFGGAPKPAGTPAA